MNTFPKVRHRRVARAVMVREFQGCAFSELWLSTACRSAGALRPPIAPTFRRGRSQRTPATKRAESDDDARAAPPSTVLFTPTPPFFLARGRVFHFPAGLRLALKACHAPAVARERLRQYFHRRLVSSSCCRLECRRHEILFCFRNVQFGRLAPPRGNRRGGPRYNLVRFAPR